MRFQDGMSRPATAFRCASQPFRPAGNCASLLPRL